MASLPRRSNPSVYRTVLGPAFDALHPSVQRAHLAPLKAHGALDVIHGTHWLTPLFLKLFRLPAAGLQQDATLRIEEQGGPAGPAEVWDRAIGTWHLRTPQRSARGLLIEQHGAATVAFALREEDGALVYTQQAMHFAQVPMWSRSVPAVSVRVTGEEAGWHLHVQVDWNGNLICRYTGSMRWDET